MVSFMPLGRPGSAPVARIAFARCGSTCLRVNGQQVLHGPQLSETGQSACGGDVPNADLTGVTRPLGYRVSRGPKNHRADIR
jgi:hypothetical protein